MSQTNDVKAIVSDRGEARSKESNHHKLLMRWEKDVPLGSRACTAPMLYALERIPDKLAAVKGLSNIVVRYDIYYD